MNIMNVDEKLYHPTYKINYEKKLGVSYFFRRELSSNVLLVTFHGAVNSDTILPCFRLSNLKIENQPNLLCFSDVLLEKLSEEHVYLGWFLDSSKIKQRQEIKEIIKQYAADNNIETIIFHGSSGGGHISLYLASELNQVAIVSNCQFILDEHSQYKDLVKGLEAKCDELEQWELNSILNKDKAPRQIISYSNVDDYTYSHHLHAESIIERLYPGKLSSVYFSGQDIAKEKKVRNHKVGFPDGLHVKDVINTYIKKEILFK